MDVIRIIIYVLFILALLALSYIDWKFYVIPPQINFFILFLGIINVITDLNNFTDYIAAFFSISTFLLILYVLTKGRAIGGGDIKLMAVSGLILGFNKLLWAFFLGCVFASFLHPIRMKLAKEGSLLALGPYLSAGMIFCLFCIS